MILSMTGYGAATILEGDTKVVAELKSLNSKFLELNIKLPRNYLSQELTLRNKLTQLLRRGKVSLVITVANANSELQSFQVNKPILKKYFEELEAVRRELGMERQTTLVELLSLPESVTGEDPEGNPKEWALIEKAVLEAAQKLTGSREEEGKALAKDVLECAENIGLNLTQVQEKMPERIDHIRSRIYQSLNDLKDRYEVDDNRFEQEMIYYIEKLDINEEIVRLKKHLQFFKETVLESASNGKKLGFITQEMGREINTIGSKANDAEIQAHVVKMKEDLERIKEQVLNIL